MFNQTQEKYSQKYLLHGPRPLPIQAISRKIPFSQICGQCDSFLMWYESHYEKTEM